MIPLLVILGPTASGKSALAVELARRLAGEVISADAFAVYRGLDIGTAKPTVAERGGIPHHLIDVYAPHERGDGSRWFALADAALREIHGRGQVPLVAGGTPLYAKLLLEGISAGPPRDLTVRARLHARFASEGAEALFAELQRVDPAYAAAHHANDERRVVRALEVWELSGRPYSSFHTTDGIRRADLRPLCLGLQWDRAELYRRIDQRGRALFARGLVEEVAALRPQLSAEAAQAVGYKEVLAHLDGALSLPDTIALVCQRSRNLAKHQLTWYRSWPDIVWLPGDAEDLATQAEALARAHLSEG